MGSTYASEVAVSGETSHRFPDPPAFACSPPVPIWIREEPDAAKHWAPLFV